MPPPGEQLDEMLRRDRWRLVALWCFGLGAFALATAVVTLGFGGIGNPKSASSVYSAFALAGLLRSFALPLTVFGVGAVAAGAIVFAVLSATRRDPNPAVERDAAQACFARLLAPLTFIRQASQMECTNTPPPFWTHWLLAVCIGVMIFGFTLVIAPELTRQAFSLLVYFSQDRINSFGPEAARYISLVHAVLGGVMFGWGMALTVVTRTLFAAGNVVGRNIIVLSVGSWFIPDTAYSLASGYWQNAVLNHLFLLLFAAPLVSTWRFFRTREA